MPQVLDIATAAEALSISEEAVALAWHHDFIDLHLDTMIPPRLWGYDPLTRHKSHRPLGGRFFGHLDLPRMEDAGLSGGMWSITTNPFRTAAGRWRTFQKNLKRLDTLVTASQGRLAFARNATEYSAAVAAGAHAVLLAIQGGNALDAAGDDAPWDRLTRVTLVHLTNSALGATSSPFSKLRADKGLSPAGVALIERLNAARVFVDLAHIHPDGFWAAVDAHDAHQPLIVTHTGVRAVCPSWRNLDDAQIRAITETGGVVGVMVHVGFLRREGGPDGPAMLVEHLEHIIKVGGESAAALGSDYDGAITPPMGLRCGAQYPVLVQCMLDRGWSHTRIRGVLGENFLRSFRALRPG